jgi:hypothetical protein
MGTTYRRDLRCAAFLVAALLLASCKAKNGTEIDASPGFHQQFELTIDGKSIAVDPNHLRAGQKLSAMIANERYLHIVFFDKDENVTFDLTPNGEGIERLAAATYPSFVCLAALGCNGDRSADYQSSTMLSPHPDAPDYKSKTAYFQAYKSTSLTLAPLMVKIDRLDKIQWKNQPALRIVGSFSGPLASIADAEGTAPRRIGPVKKVEGKFDLATTLLHFDNDRGVPKAGAADATAASR